MESRTPLVNASRRVFFRFVNLQPIVEECCRRMNAWAVRLTRGEGRDGYGWVGGDRT
jgi:hypothetical protein